MRGVSGGLVRVLRDDAAMRGVGPSLAHLLLTGACVSERARARVCVGPSLAHLLLTGGSASVCDCAGVCVPVCLSSPVGGSVLAHLLLTGACGSVRARA